MNLRYFEDSKTYDVMPRTNRDGASIGLRRRDRHDSSIRSAIDTSVQDEESGRYIVYVPDRLEHGNDDVARVRNHGEQHAAHRIQRRQLVVVGNHRGTQVHV